MKRFSLSYVKYGDWILILLSLLRKSQFWVDNKYMSSTDYRVQCTHSKQYSQTRDQRRPFEDFFIYWLVPNFPDFLEFPFWYYILRTFTCFNNITGLTHNHSRMILQRRLYRTKWTIFFLKFIWLPADVLRW